MREQIKNVFVLDVLTGLGVDSGGDGDELIVLGCVIYSRLNEEILHHVRAVRISLKLRFSVKLSCFVSSLKWRKLYFQFA